MRDFSTFYGRYWPQAKREKWSEDEKYLGSYLLTTLHGNRSGVIFLPLAYIADDIEWEIERTKEARSKLLQRGFINISECGEWLVLNNFLKYNAPASILNTKSILSHLESVDVEINLSKTIEHLKDKSCKFKGFEELSSRINELTKRFVVNAKKAPSKPLQSTIEATNTNTNTNTKTNTKLKDSCRVDTRPDEDEQTGEVILSGEQLPEETNPKAKASRQQKQTRAIEDIFQCWQSIMGHPNARLDDKRRKLIRNALKTGYAVNDLKTAILGCSYTPHNMGDNDRGQRYDGLHVIFKNADQIDRFIHNAMNQESMDANRENHQRGKDGLTFFDRDLTGTLDELWEKS